jgi:hypothetical protein
MCPENVAGNIPTHVLRQIRKEIEDGYSKAKRRSGDSRWSGGTQDDGDKSASDWISEAPRRSTTSYNCWHRGRRVTGHPVVQPPVSAARNALM